LAVDPVATVSIPALPDLFTLRGAPVSGLPPVVPRPTHALVFIRRIVNHGGVGLTRLTTIIED
jgi:hypothetical protein